MLCSEVLELKPDQELSLHTWYALILVVRLNELLPCSIIQIFMLQGIKGILSSPAVLGMMSTMFHHNLPWEDGSR